MRYLLAFVLLLLSAAAPAQRAVLVNRSANPTDMWQRVTVDTALPHPAGRVGAARYVVAHPVGVDAWAVDVRVPLNPNELRPVNFAQATPEAYTAAPLPVDVWAHFGGPLSIGGRVASLVRVSQTGAGYQGEFMVRHGETFCTRVWVTWYPDHPEVAVGELVMVSSNPLSARLAEYVTETVRVSFGDALVWSVGAGLGGRVLAAGDWLADGQGRFVPFVLCWPRHASNGWANVLALVMSEHNLGLCGVGIDRLLPEGAPRMAPGFGVVPWVVRQWPRALAELHTWNPSEIGANKRSRDAGEQEVQLYHPGGEALVYGGVGAERVRYLNALRLHAARPMNHLRADGTGVLGSPGLLFSDGAPHFHPGVNTDARGKPRDPATNYLLGPSLEQSHGFAGPDTQHHYVGDLAAVARLIPSPAAQWLLERHATVYLLQMTDTPGWATSATFGAREWGCEADLVLHLWRNLNNRELAAVVAARWRSRVVNLLVPMAASRDIIVLWNRDPRVNPDGLGAQWWQESFAAGAVWRTCDIVGPAAGKAPMLRVAKHVLNTAWSNVNGQWWGQPQGPVDGSANAGNPAGPGMNGYGMPLAVWLVRKVEPDNQRAAAIWLQLVTGGAGRFRWMLP